MSESKTTLFRSLLCRIGLHKTMMIENTDNNTRLKICRECGFTAKGWTRGQWSRQ